MSLKSLGRAATNLGRVAALVAVLLTLVLARAEVPLYVLVLALGVGVVALLALERTRAGFALFVAYMAGFVLFALLRGAADETGIDVKGQYVVDGEERLFGGVLPTEWLQDRLYDPGEIGVAAVGATVVYLTYYFAVHVVALALWRRNQAEFKRYALAVLLAVYAGLAVSSWFRRRRRGWRPSTRTRRRWRASSPRLSAGTPSRLATTRRVRTRSRPCRRSTSRSPCSSRWPSGASPRLRPVALLYLAAMGSALVYGGEHYVLDLLVSASVAVAAWLVAARLAVRRGPAPRSGSDPD